MNEANILILFSIWGMGGGFNLVWDKLEAGELYLWGNNDDGILGVRKEEKAVNKPTKMEDIKAPIKSISLGFNSFIVVTESGELFTWGKNQEGQLGISSDIPFSTYPMSLSKSNLPPIHNVSCGHNFMLAWTGIFLSLPFPSLPFPSLPFPSLPF